MAVLSDLSVSPSCTLYKPHSCNGKRMYVSALHGCCLSFTVKQIGLGSGIHHQWASRSGGRILRTTTSYSCWSSSFWPSAVPQFSSWFAGCFGHGTGFGVFGIDFTLLHQACSAATPRIRTRRHKLLRRQRRDRGSNSLPPQHPHMCNSLGVTVFWSW